MNFVFEYDIFDMSFVFQINQVIALFAPRPMSTENVENGKNSLPKVQALHALIVSNAGSKELSAHQVQQPPTRANPRQALTNRSRLAFIIATGRWQ